MKTQNETPLNKRLNDPNQRVPEKIKTENIRRGLRRMGATPVDPPRNAYESTVLYVSGGTRRLYVYDDFEGTWHYTSLT